MRKYLSLLLVATLALPACAVSRGSQAAVPVPSRGTTADLTVMAGYIRQLRVGSRVRLNRTNGDEIRGTLMKNDGDPVFIQRRARIPEAPIEVPLRDIVAPWSSTCRKTTWGGRSRSARERPGPRCWGSF